MADPIRGRIPRTSRRYSADPNESPDSECASSAPLRSPETPLGFQDAFRGEMSPPADRVQQGPGVHRSWSDKPLAPSYHMLPEVLKNDSLPFPWRRRVGTNRHRSRNGGDCDRPDSPWVPRPPVNRQVTTLSNVGESIMESGILRRESMSIPSAPSPSDSAWRSDVCPVCSRFDRHREFDPNPKGRAI